MKRELSIRSTVTDADAKRVRAIVESSGFFSSEECDIAEELVHEHLQKGEASGYLFLFGQVDGRVVGYTCYGPIPGTESSWDLYWIAVEQGARHGGAGRTLLARTEDDVRIRGGRRLYADTSSRPQYAPTQAFYERSGYARAAHLEHFFAPGDGKLIYAKVLDAAS